MEETEKVEKEEEGGGGGREGQQSGGEEPEEGRCCKGKGLGESRPCGEEQGERGL